MCATPDIEDLLDPGFYLQLVNATYRDYIQRPITLRSITDRSPRIVERIKSYFQSTGIAGGTFNSYKPAAHFLQNYDVLRGGINPVVMDNVASMFDRINSLLPDNASTSSGGSRGRDMAGALSGGERMSSSTQELRAPGITYDGNGR